MVWLAFVAVLTGLFAAAVVSVAGRAPADDLRAWADLGQAAGVFSAIAAVAALGAFVFTFSAQQREAREHRAEMRLSREALADSERQLHCAAETGLSMFHFRLMAMSIENPNLAAVWPATDPPLPEHINQQYLYCTLMLEGVWLNARAGRYSDADVRAAVAYLLTSTVFRRYWAAFRDKRERVAAQDGPESRYFSIVDELYARTE